MKPKNLYGISFDGVPLSGLVVEFCKTANVFHQEGYKIYLDLGYEIRPDKGNFFKPYDQENAFLPFWVNLTRIHGLNEYTKYTAKSVTDRRQRICSLHNTVD